MTAYILYNNVFDDSSLTITDDFTENTTYPISAMFDYKLHSEFRCTSTSEHNIFIDAGLGNTLTIDTVALIGQTLDSSGTGFCRLNESDDNITYNNFLGLKNTGTDDLPRFAMTAQESHRYWNIELRSPDTATAIPILFAGTALQCQPIGQGFRPPVYQWKQGRNRVNRNGVYMGNVVKPVPMDLRIQQRGIDPDDFRTNWVPFLEHARSKPFFFCWDVDYPASTAGSEAVYCWVDKPQQPVYESLCTMGIDLTVKAIRSIV